MEIYKINLNGREERYTFTLVNKKHYTEKELKTLIEALLSSSAIRLQMVMDVVDIHEQQRLVLEELYGLGFKELKCINFNKFIDLKYDREQERSIEAFKRIDRFYYGNNNPTDRDMEIMGCTGES